MTTNSDTILVLYTNTHKFSFVTPYTTLSTHEKINMYTQRQKNHYNQQSIFVCACV